MTLKTYYHLPAHQAPVYPQQQKIPPRPQEEQLKTSLVVQPDDLMGRHLDGEHNSLERQQVSEDEEKVVADGTLSTDQGRVLCFSIRDWDGPRSMASRRSPFRIVNVSATRDSSEEHRLWGRLSHSSRLCGEPENSNNNTSRLPRGGCDQPAAARGEIG